MHVEAERDRAESLAETRWLHAMHAEHGFPNAVVAHVDLLAADAAQQLALHLEWPLVRGVRCKPLTAPTAAGSVRGQPRSLQDERWHEGLSLLAGNGLAWDLRVPFWHLKEAAEVVARVPGLRVVLEHAGLPWDRSEAGLTHWRRGMQALAALPDVHVKLSEFGLPHAPWDAASTACVVRETVGIFGWQRCMFASNLPVSGLRTTMATLLATVDEGLSGLDAQALDAIWCGNALRFYRIDPAGR